MQTSDNRLALLVRFIGVMLLLLGAVSALLGPAETHVFQMFREGGRFYYRGFGFGSLMFGNIAIQIAGYYVIALICIPLGYGHIKLRWWAREAMKTLLVDWLIVGLPFSMIAAVILVTSKRITPAGLPFVALGFILLYPVIPIILLRFYRSQAAMRAFQAAEGRDGWLSDTPEARKVATSLLLLMAIVLHFPLLFGGFFPLFGRVMLGLRGVLLLDVSIAIAALLTWGFARGYYWPWWCAVLFLSFLIASSAVTFLSTQPLEILARMPFVPVEMDALSGMPVRGYHLALFAGAVPAATLIAAAISRRSFNYGRGD